jgi:hypothetical protein
MLTTGFTCGYSYSTPLGLMLYFSKRENRNAPRAWLIADWHGKFRLTVLVNPNVLLKAYHAKVPKT